MKHVDLIFIEGPRDGERVTVRANQLTLGRLVILELPGLRRRGKHVYSTVIEWNGLEPELRLFYLGKVK